MWQIVEELVEEMAIAKVSNEQSFLAQIERARYDIISRFTKVHQLLNERQSVLLSQLDSLSEAYKGGNVKQQIEELKELKEAQVNKYRINENKDIVMKHVSEYEERIQELSEKLERIHSNMKSVVVEWDEEVSDKIVHIGELRTSKVPDYKDKSGPLLVACKRSTLKSDIPGVFNFPQAIAIDAAFKVYVCDGGNDRVQVLSKSFEFEFEFSEKMKWPIGIGIYENKVYVAQHWGHCINIYNTSGTILKSVGKEGKKKMEFSRPRGIEISANKKTIYVCDCGNNRIQCLNLELKFHSFIPDIPEPRDVKLTPEEVVVLTSSTPCIRFYNYSNQLIRDIISKGESGCQVIEPWHFCIDQDVNILITDSSGECVYIFSSRGGMVHKFGSRGEGSGELIGPTGIALLPENMILVVSCNMNNSIQIF